MVRAQGHHDRGVEEQDVEVQDGGGHQQADREQRVPGPGRHALHHGLRPHLAGDGHVGLPAHPVPLEQVHGHGRHQQHEGQDRAALQVEEARDLQVRLGGQHREGVPGQDQRRGEIRQRGGEQEQEGVGESRDGQGQRHGAEDAPARRPQAEGHVLDVRVDAVQDRFQREVGDGKERERLGEERAAQPVHGEPLDPQEMIGDEPPRAEGEDHGDGRRERGRDQGQEARRVQDRAPGLRQVGPHRGEGEEEPQDRAREADEGGQEQAVPEGLAVVGILEDAEQVPQRERSALGERPRQQPPQREQDEQAEQDPQDEDTRRKRGIPDQEAQAAGTMGELAMHVGVSRPRGADGSPPAPRTDLVIARAAPR